eukprot:1376621-Rhodomonas_salina.1
MTFLAKADKQPAEYLDKVKTPAVRRAYELMVRNDLPDPVLTRYKLVDEYLDQISDYIAAVKAEAAAEAAAAQKRAAAKKILLCGGCQDPNISNVARAFAFSEDEMMKLLEELDEVEE